MRKPSLNLSQYSSGLFIPILVLAGAGFAFFIMLPKFKEVRQSREVLVGKQAAMEQRRNAFAGMEKIIADLEVKRSELGPLDEAIPTSPDIPELLANLEQLARQSGLLISDIQISTAPTVSSLAPGEDLARAQRAEQLMRSAENLSIMNISLNVVGQYPQLEAFFLNMERNLRLMDLQTVSFGETDEDAGGQEYNLQLETYYQKTPD